MKFVELLHPKVTFAELKLQVLSDLDSLMPQLIGQVIKEFPGISEDQARDKILEINHADPTGAEGNYTPWILKQVESEFISIPENKEEVYSLLRFYDLNRKKSFWTGSKDIYQYTYDFLNTYINELKSKELGKEKSR